MKELHFRKTVLNKEIEAIVIDTGSGLNVTIAGGDKGHIGAVSVKKPDLPLISHEFPTHREGIVADKWALALEERLQVPVAVSAGVHYDNVTRNEIDEILTGLDGLLQETITAFGS